MGADTACRGSEWGLMGPGDTDRDWGAVRMAVMRRPGPYAD